MKSLMCRFEDFVVDVDDDDKDEDDDDDDDDEIWMEFFCE